MVCSSLKSSQLGKLVLSSGILDLSWSKISELHGSTYDDKNPALRTKIYHEAEYIIAVFSAPPIFKNSSPTRISGETNAFSFLYSEKISSFSLHTPALDIFTSKYDELSMLKSELLKSQKPVIITGAALGGSVASLFTLWLLERVEPRKKRPLCITFGSPLIGDASLQHILQHSVRNSCFLHVAEAAKTPITEDVFRPSGTFLICFDSECICIDDPEAVLELLNGVKKDLVGWTDYGKVIKRLHHSSMAESSLMIDDVIDRMEERARKKKLRFDQSKLMNDMKIAMIHLEWYVKQSKKLKICSYDYFKTQTNFPYSQFRKEVNDFFKSLVEDVENMPRKEKSILKTISLYAGNNYRRLVEPFDIAEHYRSGRKEYRTTGRSRHYVMFEKWFKESDIKRCIHRHGKDLSDLITLDSCFWAEVEEAIIAINLLKTNEGMKHEELIGKLVRFEEYVWEIILRNEVSPEIFFEKSSFMSWWKEYKEIKRRYGCESTTPSPFFEFMNSEMYKSYGLPFTKDSLKDSETAPRPGDKLNTFKEEEGQKVALKVRDDYLQVFFYGIHLRDYYKNPDEKSKALNTISKISGVFPTVQWFEKDKVIIFATSFEAREENWSANVASPLFATMDPIEKVEKLGNNWNVKIVNIWRSKKAKPNKESSKEKSEKQVEVGVKTKNAKDGKSGLSGDSGSGCIIATVRGKSTDTALSMRNPNHDWSSFCEFLSTHQPPLTLSECTAENVIDFLRMQEASGDVEALAGHFSAMCEAYGIKLKENPFHSLAVQEYVEKATRESKCILVFTCKDRNYGDERYFLKTILEELLGRAFTPLIYNLSWRDNLDTELLDRSNVGIVVLSNRYYCSTDSLAHLVAIMEHWAAKKFVTTPVRVTLSDNGLEEVQLQCLNPIQADRVQNWKAAMAEIVSVNGHGWTKEPQVIVAKEVVRNTCTRLDLKNYTNVARTVASLKDLKPSDVEIVGLWGMAGVGKTSIAREIYETLAPDYDLCYFLQDFYLTCQDKGPMKVRDDFFSKVFGEESISACNIKPSFMRDWSYSKKILVVLDDVSNASDVEAVLGGFGWISHGHRIILTSRRKQLLVQCKIKDPYEIRRLSKFESSRFCKQYLNGESEVIKELVSCSSGIPLSLEALGSSVSKQHINDMKKHLQDLRRNPPTQIKKTFQRSFDELDRNQRNIFLDLACFFKGENKDQVVRLLDACGFLTNLGICDLIDESLITLVDNTIEMPIPFQDFGRFIVFEEDNNDPWERSRLWDTDDITDVLTTNSGTEAIEGIFLDTSDLTCKNFIKLSPTVFDNMYGLRLLKFYGSTSGNQCKLSLPGGLDMLPDELRLLHWEHYPLVYLPENFIPENLVEINMPYSNLEKLWEEKKNLKMLKKIKLSHSRNLTDILMLSEALNLEDIDLEGCKSLVDISTSIPRCGKLVSLNMKDCSSLRTLPAMLHLTSLNLLNLSGCSEIEEVQDFAPNLKELSLAGTAIRELPLSTENLTNLVTLDLKNCSRLQQLPPGIKNSKSIVLRL